MNGFLNVLKPPGMTSAAVVATVKRLSGESRVGHAGTLDPEACGILPVMVGRATRLFDYLVDKEKTYIAECSFGCATDTQDATGRVTKTGQNYPSRQQIEAAAAQLTGDIWQKPGMFSAIKQDGRPMYEKARKGEIVDIPARLVHVSRIQLHAETEQHGIMMTIDCGRGTYIRSICEDIGNLVDCPAHMRFLLRAKTGPFDLSTAHTLEELSDAAAANRLSSLLLPLDYPLSHLTALDVPDHLAKQVRNGVHLSLSSIPNADTIEDGKPVRIYLKNQFWGIVNREQDRLVWRAQIPPEEHC